MERRKFLLGLIGGLAAAHSLVSAGTIPAEAASTQITPPTEGPEAAEFKAENLDGVVTEHTQYYRRRGRRVYRR